MTNLQIILVLRDPFKCLLLWLTRYSDYLSGVFGRETKYLFSFSQPSKQVHLFGYGYRIEELFVEYTPHTICCRGAKGNLRRGVKLKRRKAYYCRPKRDVSSCIVMQMSWSAYL